MPVFHDPCFLIEFGGGDLLGFLLFDNVTKNILHYATVHERVCLCTHFLRTHLMKKLLLECSVQTPLAGVSEQRAGGGRGR